MQFSAFEKWWDDQRQHQEVKGPSSSNATTTGTAPTLGSNLSDQIAYSGSATVSSGSSAVATEKKVAIGLEGVNMGGFGLGFGLRAAMPKMPSFRVRISFDIDLFIFFLSRFIQDFQIVLLTFYL